MGRTAGGSSSLYNRLMEYIASGRGEGMREGNWQTHPSLSLSIHPVCSRQLSAKQNASASVVIHIPSLKPEKWMGCEDRMLDGEKWRIKKVMILLFKAKELAKEKLKRCPSNRKHPIRTLMLRLWVVYCMSWVWSCMRSRYYPGIITIVWVQDSGSTS